MASSVAENPTTGDTLESTDVQDILLGTEKKLVVLPGASTHAASFQVEKEDHTLARNSICYSPNDKDPPLTLPPCSPDVEFCGYTIPHPSEPKMNIRIQTWEDTETTAFDALRKGLMDMIEACDVVHSKFEEARDDFKS